MGAPVRLDALAVGDRFRTNPADATVFEKTGPDAARVVGPDPLFGGREVSFSLGRVVFLADVPVRLTRAQINALLGAAEVAGEDAPAEYAEHLDAAVAALLAAIER